MDDSRNNYPGRKNSAELSPNEILARIRIDVEKENRLLQAQRDRIQADHEHYVKARYGAYVNKIRRRRDPAAPSPDTYEGWLNKRPHLRGVDLPPLVTVTERLMRDRPDLVSVVPVEGPPPAYLSPPPPYSLPHSVTTEQEGPAEAVGELADESAQGKNSVDPVGADTLSAGEVGVAVAHLRRLAAVAGINQPPPQYQKNDPYLYEKLPTYEQMTDSSAASTESASESDGDEDEIEIVNALRSMLPSHRSPQSASRSDFGR